MRISKEEVKYMKMDEMRFVVLYAQVEYEVLPPIHCNFLRSSSSFSAHLHYNAE